MTPPRSRPADPGDVIRAQVVLEEHDQAPDGSFAIVVKRVVAGNGYVSHLWQVPLGRRAIAPPRRLTSGRVRDTRPRISPDGRRVAFRRRLPGAPDSVSSLHVLELDGGRAWTLSRGRHEVEEAEWSPDGRRLAFTAETGPARFIVGADAGRGEPTARVIRRLDFRYDESGFLDRWAHLFVVDAAPRAPARQLTAGDFGVAGIAWHPDGRTIAFAADRKPGGDLRPGASIWSVDADAAGGKEPADPALLLELAAWAGRPSFSPDGRWLAATGVDIPHGPDDVSPTLFVAPADGSGPAVALAPELDRPVGHWNDTDLTGWTADSRTGPFWLDDGTAVAIVSDRGRAVPWAFPVDAATGRAGGAPERLVVGDADATCFSLSVGGEIVSVLGTVETRAPELLTVDCGELRARTSIGSRWQARFGWPEMRRVIAPGAGGDIETWIASPADAGDRPLPTVVDVHGGPLGAWAPAPSVEVMLLVERGYRVVLPNIRGSATYGRGWIRGAMGDWGGVDADDVHAALDHAVGLGLVDPARLGVLGLSYGGFMVHWLIGTSERFRAAVSENGVANQVSAWANSDSGVEYNRAASLGDALSPDGVDKLWRQSPLRHVTSIRTPLLMLQAGADLRCPPADNEQLFTALRVLGREVEYVLYPDEYHVYQASGRPDRRIDRMTRMLDWFDRHLLGAEQATGARVSGG
jgi:dipeptidyl aminopeptidase/acylaminoacyl peptidase